MYRNFQPVIRRAEIACEASGHTVSDHFAHVRNMIAIGSGARRRIEDVRLSRYACYLIVQNADPDKPVVALGQTYPPATLERLRQVKRRCDPTNFFRYNLNIEPVAE